MKSPRVIPSPSRENAELALVLALPRFDHSKIEQWKKIGATVGRPDIVRDLVSGYSEVMDSLIPRLEDWGPGLSKDDLSVVLQKAKSSCGNMGFQRLQRLCEFGETLARSNEADELEIHRILAIIVAEYRASADLLART